MSLEFLFTATNSSTEIRFVHGSEVARGLQRTYERILGRDVLAVIFDTGFLVLSSVRGSVYADVTSAVPLKRAPVALKMTERGNFLFQFGRCVRVARAPCSDRIIFLGT